MERPLLVEEAVAGEMDVREVLEPRLHTCLSGPILEIRHRARAEESGDLLDLTAAGRQRYELRGVRRGRDGPGVSEGGDADVRGGESAPPVFQLAVLADRAHDVERPPLGEPAAR